MILKRRMPHPSIQFVMRGREGWVLYYPSNDLMLWVPPEFRSGLYSAGVVDVIIGIPDNTKIELSQFVHGNDWFKCQEQTC